MMLCCELSRVVGHKDRLYLSFVERKGGIGRLLRHGGENRMNKGESTRIQQKVIKIQAVAADGHLQTELIEWQILVMLHVKSTLKPIPLSSKNLASW